MSGSAALQRAALVTHGSRIDAMNQPAQPSETSKARVLAALLLLGLIVLIGATVYQLAFALSLLSFGTLPGKGPAGSDLAVIAALMAMVEGAAVSLVFSSPLRLVRGLEAALAPAAATFVTARFYTFDPYYFPALRRISENGVVPAAWIFALFTAALLVGLCAWTWPALGSRLTGLLLILCLFTTIL